MTKIIAIDTEYNNSKRILSFASYNGSTLNEIFFKNSVDKFSFKIHGIAQDFLEDKFFFKDKEKEIKSDLLSYEYIVGFDIKHDLQVLGFTNADYLCESTKIIDLRFVFLYLGISLSLSDIFQSMSLKVMKTLISHTAIHDSFITFKILELIINFANIEGISKENVLNDMANISSSHYLNKDMNGLSWLFKYLSKINFMRYSQDLVPEYYNFNQDFISFFSSHEELIYRFPVKYLNVSSLNDLKEIQLNKNIFLSIKFSKKYVSKKVNLYKGVSNG
jgi:DNA polymerase III epsilon subunit-like protein